MQIQTNTRVTIDSVFQPVLSTLSRLVRRVTGEGGASAEVNQLQTLLETLPLGSDEFGIACNRLRNAQRYLQSNEAGAARWELNALASQLRSRANAETREPRRKLKA